MTISFKNHSVAVWILLANYKYITYLITNNE